VGEPKHQSESDWEVDGVNCFLSPSRMAPVKIQQRSLETAKFPERLVPSQVLLPHSKLFCVAAISWSQRLKPIA
jgi:hypothetical protein